MGLTPREAIAAATVQAAGCLGLPAYGRLEAGSLADLVGVVGDPFADISLLTAPSLVIKGGQVVVAR